MFFEQDTQNESNIIMKVDNFAQLILFTHLGEKGIFAQSQIRIHDKTFHLICNNFIFILCLYYEHIG